MKKLIILMLVLALSAGVIVSCVPENNGNDNDSGDNTGDNTNNGGNSDNGNDGGMELPGGGDSYYDPDGWTKPE